MPTGYTADVQSGKMTSLREFAFRCARGMGALVMMRDEPLDAEIPERFEPSDFYAQKLSEAQAELAKLRAMSPTDWQAAADAELAARKEAADAYLAEKDEQRARYNSMIAKVEAWQGAPEGLKDFMLDQLRDSRQFDCPAGTRRYESLDPMTDEEWKTRREEELMEASARYAAEHQKEVDRTEGRNAWLAQLRAALEHAGG